MCLVIPCSRGRKDPLVSVIVPVYNHDKFIGRCLRSLLDQSMPQSEYEILVINDGSTDNTAYALSLFSDPVDSTVRLFENQHNIVLPATHNRGILDARGEYIVRVDSDDFVNRNFLSFLYCYLTCNPDYDAVACDYIMVDDNENVIGRRSSSADPIACGIMFRKEDMIEVGLYDCAFLRHEEKEFRHRFEKLRSITRLIMPLYRYRQHDSNITSDVVEMDAYYQLLLSKHPENDAKCPE